MPREYLGEFEETILAIVGILDGKAYGVLVMQELVRQISRKANISAVHSALRRLEKKGLVNSDWSDASPERGGRRKRLFKITADGYSVLRALRDQRLLLWGQIPGLQ